MVIITCNFGYNHFWLRPRSVIFSRVDCFSYNLLLLSENQPSMTLRLINSLLVMLAGVTMAQACGCGCGCGCGFKFFELSILI